MFVRNEVLADKICKQEKNLLSGQLDVYALQTEKKITYVIKT